MYYRQGIKQAASLLILCLSTPLSPFVCLPLFSLSFTSLIFSILFLTPPFLFIPFPPPSLFLHIPSCFSFLPSFLLPLFTFILSHCTTHSLLSLLSPRIHPSFINHLFISPSLPLSIHSTSPSTSSVSIHCTLPPL